MSDLGRGQCADISPDLLSTNTWLQPGESKHAQPDSCPEEENG